MQKVSIFNYILLKYYFILFQICAIDMEMPNKHYFNVDFTKFPKIIQGVNDEVFLPVDKPSGIIYAKLDRKMLKSKL